MTEQPAGLQETVVPQPGGVRPLELRGAVALVTGGGQGLGLAYGRRLVAEGATLVLCDLPGSKGEAAAAELGATWVPLDVTDPEANRRAVAAAEEQHGGLDLAVLNAGIPTGCGLGDDFDADKYRRANGVNLDGVVYGIAAALPALRRRGGGALVATASLAGLAAPSYDPVYVANKAAVIGLVRSLGPALAADGIAVHALCPSYAETAIITGIRPFLESDGTPIIDPEHVAEALVRAVTSGGTGECWVVQVGLITPYRFRGVPGPKV